MVTAKRQFKSTYLSTNSGKVGLTANPSLLILMVSNIPVYRSYSI